MFGSRIRSKFVLTIAAPIAVVMVAVVGTPVEASSPSAIPVVSSFTATKTTISNAGGSTVLKAKLKYATTCKISVSPGLKGFPKSFACASSFTKTVSLSANKGQNPIAYSFELSVKNKAGSAQATNVAVTEGAAPPPISFTTPTGNPTTLVFPPEGVFVADDPLVVTVHNNSPTTQVITGVTIGTTGDPNDFLLNRNNCGYITSHQTCSLAVQFTPSGAGKRTGVVDIVDSSWGKAGAIVPLKLQGPGVWADATVASANIKGNLLTFPTQYGVATTSSVQYISFVNVGNVPLYISGLGDTGGENTDFLVTPGNCVNPVTAAFPLVVAVGQSCTFDVAFEPSASGLRTTNVVVDDNTIGTQTQLQVQGTGAYSATSLTMGADPAATSPIYYTFPGTTGVGASVNATLTITNTSTVGVAFTGAPGVSSVTKTGTDPADFAVVQSTNSPSPTCGAGGVELAVGQSCTLTITFSPQAQGTRQATLNIFDNSPNGGETVTVTGTGTLPV